MRIETEINGQLVNDPINLKELSIELSFDNNNYEKKVSLPRYRFGVGYKTDDSAKILNTILNDGLNGGVGVFEGVPFKQYLVSKGKRDLLIDGFIDLTTARISCSEIEADVTQSGGIDILKDKADSFTFEYLYQKTGNLTVLDNVAVPYCINSIPDSMQIAMSLFMVFSLTTTIKQETQMLIEYIQSTVNPFEGSALFRLITRILYITFLVVSIIALIYKMFNAIIQPVKYHLAMSVKKQLEAGAKYMGFEFSSSILSGDYEKLYIIPEKYSQVVDPSLEGILGAKTPKIEQHGYFNGTYKQLLLAIKEMFNAKIFIIGKTIYLEKKNFTKRVSTYSIPPVVTDFNRLNTEDFVSNYMVSFQTDIGDKNTIQEYAGTSLQAIITPISINNQANVLTRNLTEVSIPFALAKKKTELTTPEKIFDAFFKVVGGILNAIIKVVNGAISAVNFAIDLINDILDALDFIGITVDFRLDRLTPLELSDIKNLISNRIGMLKIENDFINSPKLVMLEVSSNPALTKISDLNSTKLTAEYLYDNYHYVNSFVPSKDNLNGNQYYIYENVKVPFCVKNYYEILGSEVCNNGVIDSVKWSPFNNYAEINYRVPKLYTRNLQLSKIIPDGK